MEYYVKSTVYDKNTKQLKETERTLVDVTEFIRFDLTKLLVEIQTLASKMCGTTDKDKWPAQAKQRFDRIRHIVLDNANAVARIPSGLFTK